MFQRAGAHVLTLQQIVLSKNQNHYWESLKIVLTLQQIVLSKNGGGEIGRK